MKQAIRNTALTTSLLSAALLGTVLAAAPSSSQAAQTQSQNQAREARATQAREGREAREAREHTVTFYRGNPLEGGSPLGEATASRDTAPTVPEGATHAVLATPRGQLVVTTEALTERAGRGPGEREARQRGQERAQQATTPERSSERGERRAGRGGGRR